MAEEPRMLIRTESEAETKRILDAFAQAHIEAQTEFADDCTLIYVSAADEARAQKLLSDIGALDLSAQPEQPQPAAKKGRVNSIVLTILMLLLIVAAVYGTDAIVAIFQRFFS